MCVIYTCTCSYVGIMHVCVRVFLVCVCVVCRELVCHSLEGRRVDLITISSYHGFESKREPRLDRLFLDTATERAHTFTGKKVCFSLFR